MDWASVLAWRVQRQHLARRAPRKAALDVVSDIAGLHAQVTSSAELTLWARVEDLEPGAVSDALWEERALVKTWAMRGTLHFLRADELPAYIGAQLAIPARHEKASWLRAFGVSAEEMSALMAAVPAVLDGEALTREQLATAVAIEAGSPALAEKLRDGFGALLKPSAFRGDVCFATSDGRHVRFARPDRWLGAFEPEDPASAMAEIARRYLRAYGPATRERFARWFGIASPAQAGKALTALGDTLAEVDVEGTPALMLAADLGEAEAAAPAGTVCLLPAFDQCVVGAPRDVDAVLAPEHRPRVYRPQGWLSAVLLVDGVMTGTWEHERKGGELRVAIAPFEPISATVREAAEAEAERLARYFGSSLALEWS